MRSWNRLWREGLLLGVTGLLAGCTSDLSGYRPVAKSEPAPSSVQRVETADSNSQGSAEQSVDHSATGTDALLQDLPASALHPVNVVDGASVAMLLKSTPAENPMAKAASGGAVVPVAAKADDKPRVVEVLIPEKTFRRDGASQSLRVSYDDLDLLKVLNMDPVTENAVDLMPEWLKQLNGQRVRIRGFMFPTFEAEGLEQFVLARDNQICCFGRDPKVYDLVQVDMKAGKTTNYIPATRPFDVVGRFQIKMVYEDGKPFGLYYIDDAEVIDR